MKMIKDNRTELDIFVDNVCGLILCKIPKHLQIYTGFATYKDVKQLIEPKFNTLDPQDGMDCTVYEMYEEGKTVEQAVDCLMIPIMVLLNGQAGAM